MRTWNSNILMAVMYIITWSIRVILCHTTGYLFIVRLPVGCQASGSCYPTLGEIADSSDKLSQNYGTCRQLRIAIVFVTRICDFCNGLIVRTIPVVSQSFVSRSSSKSGHTMVVLYPGPSHESWSCLGTRLLRMFVTDH